MGVNAPTRKAVSAVSADAYERYLKGETSAVPSWMQIKESDSEKAKEKKRRALKSLKKKKRCAASPPRPSPPDSLPPLVYAGQNNKARHLEHE